MAALEDILKPRRLTTMRGISSVTSPYGGGQSFRDSFGPGASPPPVGHATAVGPLAPGSTSDRLPGAPPVTPNNTPGRSAPGQWSQDGSRPPQGGPGQMFGPGGQWAGAGAWMRGGIGAAPPMPRHGTITPSTVMTPALQGTPGVRPGGSDIMGKGGFGQTMGVAKQQAEAFKHFNSQPQQQGVSVNTGQLGPRETITPGGGGQQGGYGSTSSGLEGTPPQDPGAGGAGNSQTGDVQSGWAQIEQYLASIGYRLDENGNIWDGDERVGNIWNDEPYDQSRYSPSISKGTAEDLARGAKNRQTLDTMIALWKDALGDQQGEEAQSTVDQRIAQLLEPIEAPQIDQAKVQAMTDASKRQLAFEQAKALTTLGAQAGRARMSPEALSGLSADVSQQRAIAENAQSAQIRLQAEITNHQANLRVLDQEIQNARIAASFAMNQEQAAIAFAREKELIQYQSQIVMRMQEAERERTKWSQILGTIGTLAGAVYGGYAGGPVGAQAYSQIGGGFGAGLGGIVG